MRNAIAFTITGLLLSALGALASTPSDGSEPNAPELPGKIQVWSNLGTDQVGPEDLCILAGSDGRDRLVENYGLLKRGTFPLAATCRFESGRTLCYYDEFQPGPGGTPNSVPCTHSSIGIQKCTTSEEAFPSGSQVFHKVLSPAFSRPLEAPVPNIPRCLI